MRFKASIAEAIFLHNLQICTERCSSMCSPKDLTKSTLFILLSFILIQPRSQGFSLFVIGKAGKGPGTGGHMSFNTQI